MTLDRLGRAECAQLVANVATAQGLSAETVAAIVVKTDGVPLFIEELTKSVMEAAGEGADGARDAEGFADGAPRPARRCARSGPDRSGDRPAIPVLVARRGWLKGDTKSKPRWRSLDAAGIVFPEGRGLERGYSFKHALVREAAYESLL